MTQKCFFGRQTFHSCLLRTFYSFMSFSVFFFWAGVLSQMVPQVEKDTCRQSMKRDPVVPRWLYFERVLGQVLGFLLNFSLHLWFSPHRVAFLVVRFLQLLNYSFADGSFILHQKKRTCARKKRIGEHQYFNNARKKQKNKSWHFWLLLLAVLANSAAYTCVVSALREKVEKSKHEQKEHEIEW